MRERPRRETIVSHPTGRADREEGLVGPISALLHVVGGRELLERERLQRVVPGATPAHEDVAPGPGSDLEFADGPRVKERVCVLGEHRKGWPASRSTTNAISVRVEDPPPLDLAGTNLGRRVQVPVDVDRRFWTLGATDRHGLAVLDLCARQDDPSLRELAQRRHFVEATLHHDRPGHSREDLPLHEHVEVWVVPVGARRVVLRELVCVGELVPRVDLQEHVVVVRSRRDVESVRVQVGRLRKVVDQVDRELVPIADHQRGPRVASVIVHRDHAAMVDPNRTDRRAQSCIEQAIPAVAQRRLGEAIVDQRRDISVACRAPGRALGTRLRRAPSRAHTRPRYDASQRRSQHNADQPRSRATPHDSPPDGLEHDIHYRHVCVKGSGSVRSIGPTTACRGFGAAPGRGRARPRPAALAGLLRAHVAAAGERVWRAGEDQQQFPPARLSREAEPPQPPQAS